jgi:hypothetical protein
VKVYYNPQKPKQSVLDPHNQSGVKTMGWIAGAFIVIGIIFFILGFVVEG